jgi:hypothetical protein
MHARKCHWCDRRHGLACAARSNGQLAPAAADYVRSLQVRLESLSCCDALLGVGTAAGAFGSLVGVGSGVLIGPVILNACP